MNGADLAASLIRHDARPHNAIVAASVRTGTPYRAIASELGRRNARNRREAVEARERAAVRMMEEEAERLAAQWNEVMNADKQLTLKGVEQ